MQRVRLTMFSNANAGVKSTDAQKYVAFSLQEQSFLFIEGQGVHQLISLKTRAIHSASHV